HHGGALKEGERRAGGEQQRERCLQGGRARALQRAGREPEEGQEDDQTGELQQREVRGKVGLHHEWWEQRDRVAGRIERVGGLRGITEQAVAEAARERLGAADVDRCVVAGQQRGTGGEEEQG